MTIKALGPLSISTESAISSISASVTSVVLLPASERRSGFVVKNTGASATLHLALAATASTTTYTISLAAGDAVAFDDGEYCGAVSAVWSAAEGGAVVTEFK